MQVATKLFVIEQQKKQAERLQKVKHIYIYIYNQLYVMWEHFDRNADYETDDRGGRGSFA